MYNTWILQSKESSEIQTKLAVKRARGIETYI